MILRDTARKVTYVIGHRNPDTDAICSAIAYADFLKQTTRPDAVAACCGQINSRTEWLLEYVEMDPPLLLVDLRPTASWICRRNVLKAEANDTFLDVYQRMLMSNVRSVPVVDEQNRVIGMPTTQDILKLLLPTGGIQAEARKVTASLQNITRVVEGQIENPIQAWQEEELLLMVGASSIETVTDRIKGLDAEKLIVVVGDRPKIQRLALEYPVRALILTGGHKLSDELRGLAVQNGVSVITCNRDSASTAQLIRTARKVSSATESEFLSFKPTDFVHHIKREVGESNQPLFPVVHPKSGELIGVFSKSDLIQPPRARIILVDHNEFSQAVMGADESEIIEVIDHHRLSGDLTSKEPMRFINETLGSTCSIVARMFMTRGLEPSKTIATCMCAGIISDTLHLTSPTTTEEDKAILKWLSKIAEIETEKFAQEFFAAGSALTTLAPDEVITSDRKEYHESGWKISISQIEELGLHQFWPKQKELQYSLDALVHDKNLDFACVMVTDITKHHSLLLTSGAQKVINAIEYPQTDGGLFELAGVVSRKKQLFPMLGQVLSKIPKD